MSDVDSNYGPDEALAEIRERANLQCGLDGDDADDLLIHVDHLTADNARLREGIERVRGHVHESWLHQGDVRLIEDALDDCDALLNPPTEACACGFGGVHDDVNPRCAINQQEKDERKK